MKFMAIPAKFHPRKTFKFPKRSFAAVKKVERSFKARWCADFQWLHYDVKSDSAFCHLCLTAEVEKKLLASMKNDPAFLTIKRIHLLRTEHGTSHIQRAAGSQCYS